MLTHFRKMAPFCIVDILILFPCLPQPLHPKINVEFWTSSLFFTSDNIDSGVGGFTAFKRNETINELNVVKSTRLKQVCQLLLSLIVSTNILKETTFLRGVEERAMAAKTSF